MKFYDVIKFHDAMKFDMKFYDWWNYKKFYNVMKLWYEILWCDEIWYESLRGNEFMVWNIMM